MQCVIGTRKNVNEEWHRHLERRQIRLKDALTPRSMSMLGVLTVENLTFDDPSARTTPGTFVGLQKEETLAFQSLSPLTCPVA